MKIGVLISTLFISVLGFSQYVDEPDSASIHLYIVNPTNYDLTIIASERQNKFVYSKITTVPKQDSVKLSFVAELRVDRVPQDRYQFKIFETDYYYEINDHYYWECDRIEGETYQCVHHIKNYIKIDSTKQFDSLAFRQEELKNMPFYQSFEVEKQAEYEGGWPKLLKDIEKEIDFSTAKESVRNFFEIIVDENGKVVNAYSVKSSHPEFDDQIEKFFLKNEFTPAEKDGRMVASKVVLPIRINIDK